MPGPSILLVGCDPYLAGIYGRKFELDGWVVDVAESLEEGERKASRSRPNILLLDTGCVVDVASEMTRLRRLPTLLKTKLVVLSRSASKDQVQAVRHAGADAYLLAGHFVPQEATAKMRRLLET